MALQDNRVEGRMKFKHSETYWGCRAGSFSRSIGRDVETGSVGYEGNVGETEGMKIFWIAPSQSVHPITKGYLKFSLEPFMRLQ